MMCELYNVLISSVLWWKGMGQSFCKTAPKFPKSMLRMV